MFPFLRFVGPVNAAVWLGSAIFLTFAAGPAFFSPEMLSVMPRYHAGRAAQIVLSRYFNLQLVCASIAVVHLAAAWFYAGRAPARWNRILPGVLLGLVLVGGLWMQPKLRDLHAVMYAPNTTEPQKEAAKRSFGMWHGVSQSANLLLTIGVLLYFWQVANPNPNGRPHKLGLGTGV
jgi:hypothetical protein